MTALISLVLANKLAFSLIDSIAIYLPVYLLTCTAWKQPHSQTGTGKKAPLSPGGSASESLTLEGWAWRMGRLQVNLRRVHM